MNRLSPSPYLSREEQKELMKKNDALAGFQVLIHLAWIFVAFALVYFFPTWWAIIVSLWILGGRQLACSVLMHDGGHFAIFSNKKVNDWVGEWLGAYPVFHKMGHYRPYHRIHHLTTGLEEDPDLLLTRGYPTSRRSMIRKFTRDLFGITGIKSFVGLTMMHLGYLTYNLGGKAERVSQENRSWPEFWKILFKNLSGPIIANLILFGICWLAGAPLLYLLWPVAYISTFQFCLRIRAMAEHSMVEDSTDPLRNTRTTYANWFERMFFAPFNVNYHLEHHMMMGVPSYNLPKMHRLIKERGFYEVGLLEKNYWRIVQAAMRKQA